MFFVGSSVDGGYVTCSCYDTTSVYRHNPTYVSMCAKKNSKAGIGLCRKICKFYSSDYTCGYGNRSCTYSSGISRNATCYKCPNRCS